MSLISKPTSAGIIAAVIIFGMIGYGIVITYVNPFQPEVEAEPEVEIQYVTITQTLVIPSSNITWGTADNFTLYDEEETNITDTLVLVQVMGNCIMANMSMYEDFSGLNATEINELINASTSPVGQYSTGLIGFQLNNMTGGTTPGINYNISTVYISSTYRVYNMLILPFSVQFSCYINGVGKSDTLYQATKILSLGEIFESYGNQSMFEIGNYNWIIKDLHFDSISGHIENATISVNDLDVIWTRT